MNDDETGIRDISRSTERKKEGGRAEGKGGRERRNETTPTSVFRSRMEISFASFLRLIRRETEPRGRCRFADFGKGKQKGRNKGGGDAEDAHGRCTVEKGGRGEKGRPAGDAEGLPGLGGEVSSSE